MIADREVSAEGRPCVDTDAAAVTQHMECNNESTQAISFSSSAIHSSPRFCSTPSHFSATVPRKDRERITVRCTLSPTGRGQGEGCENPPVIPFAVLTGSFSAPAGGRPYSTRPCRKGPSPARSTLVNAPRFFRNSPRGWSPGFSRSRLVNAPRFFRNGMALIVTLPNASSVWHWVARP